MDDSCQGTLEVAASMVGATVNQFIVQTALREAERIIEQERVIRLSTRDAEAFLRTMANITVSDRFLSMPSFCRNNLT